MIRGLVMYLHYKLFWQINRIYLWMKYNLSLTSYLRKKSVSIVMRCCQVRRYLESLTLGGQDMNSSLSYEPMKMWYSYKHVANNCHSNISTLCTDQIYLHPSNRQVVIHP